MTDFVLASDSEREFTPYRYSEGGSVGERSNIIWRRSLEVHFALDHLGPYGILSNSFLSIFKNLDAH